MASSAMLQRMGAAAEEGEHLLAQAAAASSRGHADVPMIGSGASAAEMIATHLASALGALVQQTVLLADPRTASAHTQQQQQQQQGLPVQRDETPQPPIPPPAADSKKNVVVSTQNIEFDDDDEGMEEVKADDYEAEDDDDGDGKAIVQITRSQAPTSSSSSSSGPAPPSEAVLTAVLRDVEASRRFMLSMRQFDLTSEGSLSPASSHSDISHIHNPNQFSSSHFSHRRRTWTGTGSEGNHERWHNYDDEDNSSVDSDDTGDEGVSINRGAATRAQSDQPMPPSKLDQHRHPTMLVSSVLACPSTRAVIAIGDEALLEGCHDSSNNHDLGLSAAGGTTLRRLHVNARSPPPATTSIPVPVPALDQDGNNEAKDGENGLPAMKRPVSFTQLLDETNTTDDDLDDDDDVLSEKNNASHLAAPPQGIRLWTTAKKL